MIKHQHTVQLAQQSYPIYIGDAIYNDRRLLREHIAATQLLIVTNTTIADLYLESLLRSLRTLVEIDYEVVILPDGEQYKNRESWNIVINALVDGKHHRDTTVISLGGGVIGDIAGFAAATYQRGVTLIHMPTSLLAQVDASIGGKTAINHEQGKNLIGCFYQPTAVLIDTDFLQTLAPRELRAGLAEIVKSALIADYSFFSWLESNYQAILSCDPESLTYAIHMACSIKQTLVQRDEKERHVRAFLNLGHTFGHAIEYLMGYGTLLHGEAVSIGIVLAARLSAHQGYLKECYAERIEHLLEQIGLPTKLPSGLSRDAIIHAMEMDKKVQRNTLHFVLLRDIGSVRVCDDVLMSTLTFFIDNHIS